MAENLGQMRLEQKHGVPFLAFEQLCALPYIAHGFSTRNGGVSEREFASMNLYFNRGDDPEHVLENYRRFCRAIGVRFDNLVASAQNHGVSVRRVGAEHVGFGIWRQSAYAGVDGLLTNEPGIVLVTYFADCVPLYFVDTAKRGIGLAHAGWRGTLAEMGACMVKAMRREFGSRPQDLTVAIGPSIGRCCYEVDAPVAQKVAALSYLTPQNYLQETRAGKYMLDLWALNRSILVHAGVPAEQILIGGVCTCCHRELFFSHRAMGEKRGGMAAMLALRE